MLRCPVHDARHTAATLLLQQQGVPARVAMEILGHSQISLTLGTYSQVVPEVAEDAARRMGEALWAEWPPDWHHDAPTSPGRTARSPRSGRVGRQGIEP
jgi:hypothetical protein